MEARAILLTSLVFALWTSSTTGQDFCTGRADGPYCEHCMQPVQCTSEVATENEPCEAGMACTVDSGVSSCALHTQTDCACTGVGDQCDAYNIVFIEHCLDSGPFLVEKCPMDAPTCYKGECGAYEVCTHDGWNLTPDCTSAYFCDINGVIHDGIDCASNEYVNSALECANAPPPACDGSCTGRCPNPVDCTKFFICDGTTWLGSGNCPDGIFFDIDTNECTGGDYTCTFLNGCDFEIPTPSGEMTTTSGEITPATTGSGRLHVRHLR